MLCAPPGWGKTVVATSLIAARGCSTLVLVPRKPLVEQWAARLVEFTDISPKAIGRVGGGRRRTTKQIDIAMVQTLARADRATDFLRGYGHVVIDECHHVPAVSIERVLSAIPARYVTGLTATPYRRDGHQPIINMQCGPIRHKVDAPPRSDSTTTWNYWSYAERRASIRPSSRTRASIGDLRGARGRPGPTPARRR